MNPNTRKHNDYMLIRVVERFLALDDGKARNCFIIATLLIRLFLSQFNHSASSRLFGDILRIKPVWAEYNQAYTSQYLCFTLPRTLLQGERIDLFIPKGYMMIS